MSVQPEIEVEKQNEEHEEVEKMELNPVKEVRNASSDLDLTRTLTPDDMENDTYEVDYYFKQALLALLIHIISALAGPLGIPIMKLLFGSCLIKNMQFKISIGYLVSEFPNFCWIMYSIVLRILYPDLWIALEPLIEAVFIMFLIRTLMISLKYGYYTRKQWNKFNTKPYSTKDVMDQFLRNSWIKIPERIIKKELYYSYKRLNVNMKELTFKFKKINDNFRDYIHTHLNEEMADDRIKVSTFAEFILKKTIYKTNTKRISLMIIPSLIYAIIPYGIILYEHGLHLNPGIIGWVYMIFVFPYVATNTYWFLTIILIGVYDFSRKKMFQAQCTALLTDIDTCYFCLGVFDTKLNMLDMQTILSWYYMRSAFLDFGKRYTLRIFLYFSLIFPICLLSIVLVILMMFNLIGKEFLYLFCPGIYLIIVVMVLMSYMISAAVSLNKYFSVHRDILLSYIAQIRSLQYANVCRGKVKEKAISTILLIVEKLKQDEILHPVKIMGVKLDSSLYTKLAAVAFSGLFALVRVIFA